MANWLSTVTMTFAWECACGERHEITGIGEQSECSCGKVYKLSGQLTIGYHEPKPRPALPAHTLWTGQESR